MKIGGINIKVNAKYTRAVTVIICLIMVAVVVCIIALKQKESYIDTSSSKAKDTVTKEEMQKYRDNIGADMDIKKSILIIFNTQEECQLFISEHGADENVLSFGKGIIPQMQGENGEQYYNCVGNAVFEQLFDTMQDGQYQKTPVEFGGAYCYFKKIENYSIVNNDENLKTFIASEKSMTKGGEIK